MSKSYHIVRVGEWLLLNANSAIFQLNIMATWWEEHGGEKLPGNGQPETNPNKLLTIMSWFK